MLQRGDKGPEVKALQEQLLALGYPLPRFGADGVLGLETLGALDRFLLDHGSAPLGPNDVEIVTEEEIALVQGLAGSKAPKIPCELQDHTGKHPGFDRIRRRIWGSITGVTLHQTACLLGNKPERWYGVPAHLGITRPGLILLLNPLNYVTYHGHGLNSFDVGIEIDGYFEGVQGDLSTHWRPVSDPDREPLRPTPEQIEGTRRALHWIKEEVARHGGELRHVHAHRQSSNVRRSDPGSEVWQEVALWAETNLGLKTEPERTWGNGLKIPSSWDKRQAGVKY